MPVRRAILSWVQPRSAKSLIISARSLRISSPARMTSFMSANIRSTCASVRGAVGGSGVRRVSSSTAIARLYTQVECPHGIITRLYNPVMTVRIRVMPTFTAPDGTRLAYRLMGGGSGAGDGDPVLCVPGGPTDSRYLGDLG